MLSTRPHIIQNKARAGSSTHKKTGLLVPGAEQYDPSVHEASYIELASNKGGEFHLRRLKADRRRAAWTFATLVDPRSGEECRSGEARNFRAASRLVKIGGQVYLKSEVAAAKRHGYRLPARAPKKRGPKGPQKRRNT